MFSRARVLPGRVPRLLLVVGVVVLVATVVYQLSSTASQPPVVPASSPAAPGPRLTARGVVQPIAQAKIGTLAGGTVAQLGVAVGDSVAAQQEIARVTTANGVEVLTAPWSGTVTNLFAQVGDTVVPGTVVVAIGDLSWLRIETTDVDEFLIAHIRRGQPVTVQIEALDRLELQGQVRTVALQPETTSVGDQHYPVVVDLLGSTDELRPGMTARLTFAE